MGKGKSTPPPKPVDTARIERQKQQQAERLRLLSSLDCLYGVPQEEIERLVDLCTFRAFLTHEAIIHERDQDSSIYLLLQGSVRLTLHDKEGREVLIGILSRGDCFGGGALFGSYFRRAGAFAETDCYVLQFLLSDARALLPTAPALSQALRSIYMQRLAEFTLARVPLFSHLASMERLSLTSLLKTEHYARGSVIVEQGQPGDALYLIESGQTVVERSGQTISTLDEGDFFGEMSLLSDQPHSATVRALTPTDIALLPASEFHRLLMERPDLKAHIERVIARRRAADETLLDDQERAQRLAVAVQHGLLRGSHLLVRSPELCPPDCRICEEACAARHGHVRLSLNGFTIGKHHIADACRQCQIGAECIEACPEAGALAWSDTGVLTVTDTCTGCGECVPACPYQAVAQVPRGAGRAYNGKRASFKPFKQVLDPLQRARRIVQPVLALESTPYTHRADKCDLCHGYNDLACVSRCPADALRLVPVEEIFPL